jgi:hypothetical protein
MKLFSNCVTGAYQRDSWFAPTKPRHVPKLVARRLERLGVDVPASGSDNDTAKRQAFGRARKALIDDGLVGTDGDYAWRLAA